MLVADDVGEVVVVTVLVTVVLVVGVDVAVVVDVGVVVVVCDVVTVVLVVGVEVADVVEVAVVLGDVVGVVTKQPENPFLATASAMAAACATSFSHTAVGVTTAAKKHRKRSAPSTATPGPWYSLTAAVSNAAVAAHPFAPPASTTTSLAPLKSSALHCKLPGPPHIDAVDAPNGLCSKHSPMALSSRLICVPQSAPSLTLTNESVLVAGAPSRSVA